MTMRVTCDVCQRVLQWDNGGNLTINVHNGKANLVGGGPTDYLRMDLCADHALQAIDLMKRMS